MTNQLDTDKVRRFFECIMTKEEYRLGAGPWFRHTVPATLTPSNIIYPLGGQTLRVLFAAQNITDDNFRPSTGTAEETAWMRLSISFDATNESTIGPDPYVRTFGTASYTLYTAAGKGTKTAIGIGDQVAWYINTHRNTELGNGAWFGIRVETPNVFIGTGADDDNWFKSTIDAPFTHDQKL